MLADSDRLLATVEQVLKAGELGQRERQLNRVPLDLETLTAECISITLQRHHLAPDAILLQPVPGAVRLPISGIPEDLRTAILNLLDNAVKYSPGGIHITCRLAITRYTWATLTIADTGVGIPPKQLKRVFPPLLPRSRPTTCSALKEPAWACSSSAPSPASTVATSPPDSPGPGQGNDRDPEAAAKQQSSADGTTIKGEEHGS